MVLCESNNSIGRLETACWPPASVRLRAANTRSSRKVVTTNIPISGAGGQCETKQRLLGTRERHGMCESGFKTAGERHGMCEVQSTTSKCIPVLLLATCFGFGEKPSSCN
jgi:hypothetical protein